MLLTTSALAVFSAIWMWTTGAAQSERPGSLTVHFIIEFDRTIRSNVIKRTARNEATEIWRPYGIELLWSDGGGCDEGLHLDVNVARYAPGLAMDGLPAVLGHAMVDPSGAVRGPIRISFDAVEQLLRGRASDPVLRDYELGRALGRVLAHELGHVLLGPAHDRHGLMRARLTTDDLARYDRRNLRLSDEGTSRLRTVIARLWEAQQAMQVAERLTCVAQDTLVWESPAPRGSAAVVRTTRVTGMFGDAGGQEMSGSGLVSPIRH